MSYTEQHTGKLKRLNLKDYQAKLKFVIDKTKVVGTEGLTSLEEMIEEGVVELNKK